MKLLMNGLIKFLCGLLLVGLLLFLPAGTLKFFGAWNFIILLFVPILILGAVLLIKSPDLLQKRLNGKEEQKSQKGVVAFSALIFLVGFIVCGFDFRFGWSAIPRIVQIIAAVVFLFSYMLYAEVMRENAFLSRKIEVQENQKVVDTGLYGIVRHPMYMVTILMFLMIPLIIGSLISLVIFLFYPIVIAVRIREEEKLLTEQLEGYVEYKQRVKYRIIPFVW